MTRKPIFWCKFSLLGVLAILNLLLFFSSLQVDYQVELAKEHVRFRSGFPSQANWIPSPFGRLKCYLFNVTNSEEFLNGTDSKIKVEQVGPITYSIKGLNLISDQNKENLTYEKIRYHKTVFEPLESSSPDILNQTIILPNLVLLGAAAKLHDWVFPIRHVFNVVTIKEQVFLKNPIYYFLWDFKLPALNVLSNYMPNIVANCGMLYNALRAKPEVYNVKIGLDHGMENFFKLNSLNNRTVFYEQRERLAELETDIECPIKVDNTFDNSLFPPFLKETDVLDIVAGESCRTLRLNFTGVVKHGSFLGYRYKLGEKSDKPSCLDKSMGIRLHKGMFDVSKCLINDVPSAFSSPHFYGTTYNWSDHWEGFNPNAEDHEAHVILEPVTGIPVEERYRFQSNIPMPDMKGYRKDLEKFSNLVVPSFWYEYDLDELPTLIKILMGVNIYVMPILQPIMIIVFLILGVYYCFKMYLLWNDITLKSIISKIEKRRGKSLETTFESNTNQDALHLEAVLK